MNENHDQEFTRKLSAVLDQSVNDIDEDTRYRLQIARANILNRENDIQPWYKRWNTWATATGFASICMVALLMTNQLPIQDNATLELASAPQSSLLEDANVELYEEYDFYVWLSHQVDYEVGTDLYEEYDFYIWLSHQEINS